MIFISTQEYFFAAEGGVNNFYTEINLSENYFFVTNHCKRISHAKGVGGYMRRATSMEMDFGDYKGPS